MKNKFSRSAVPIETLESRTLLSATMTDLVHLEKRVPKVVTPHVTVSFSRRVLQFGQSVTAHVQVTAPRKLGTLAGDVEFIAGGNVISGAGAALAIPLGAHNRVSYTFSVGNIDLYLGRQAITAAFISSNTVPNSFSKPTIVNVKLPHFKVHTDGLRTATVGAGHGKGIKASQMATVLYTGFLETTGSVFDYATANHGAGSSPTFTFTVHASPEQVISGFDEGTVGMKVGETRLMAIPSQLGYGPSGSGGIPGNADLVFIIKLLSIS